MSKVNNIANRIVKSAIEIQNDAYNYFAKHKVLDHGDHLKKDVREPYVNPSHVTVDDLGILAKHASSLMDKELMKYNVNAARESAVELAVKTFSNGKYDGKISSVDFFKILNLMNPSKVGGTTMKRTAKYYSEKLDTVANEIRQLVTAGYISTREGYALEMAIDEVSDLVETKLARALEHDSDEKYMATFGEDPATKEQDADEKYMKDFKNFGQNIMGDALKEGEFDPKKKASLDAAALAEKRKK